MSGGLFHEDFTQKKAIEFDTKRWIYKNKSTENINDINKYVNYVNPEISRKSIECWYEHMALWSTSVSGHRKRINQPLISCESLIILIMLINCFTMIPSP